MSYYGSKKRSWICIFVVVFILITGICFDQIKTNSLFSCALNVESDTVVSVRNAVMWEQQTCTPKMLQLKSVSGMRAMVGWTDRQSRMESTFNQVPLDYLLRESGAVFWLWGILILLSVEAGERIANFVHKSDGKKRVSAV